MKREVWINVIGSLLSAVVISLMLTIWNDYFYKKDRLTGCWRVECETLDSKYHTFLGMKVEYQVLVTQEGSHIIGTGEKVSEDSKLGHKDYDGAERTHFELSGAITYKFFSDNQVDVHIKEDGRLRCSSTILRLDIIDNDSLSGEFVSTIADSRGRVTWTRRRDLGM